MATEEETRAIAYRTKAAARAVAMNARHLARFGSYAAYVALYNRVAAIAHVKDIEVNEWEEYDEETDEQIT